MRTRTERQTQRQSEAAGNPLNEMRTTRKNKRKKKNRSKSGETKAKKTSENAERKRAKSRSFCKTIQSEFINENTQRDKQTAGDGEKKTDKHTTGGRTDNCDLSIYLSISL